MTTERYNELMDRTEPPLTNAEITEGWHFCYEWDGLLIGPGMKETEYCTDNCPKPAKA